VSKVERAKMLMSASARARVSDAKIPVSAKLSGPRTPRQRKPRFASRVGGSTVSWQTTDNSKSVRVTETNDEEWTHAGSSASGSNRAIAKLSGRRSSSSSREDVGMMVASAASPGQYDVVRLRLCSPWVQPGIPPTSRTPHRAHADNWNSDNGRRTCWVSEVQTAPFRTSRSPSDSLHLPRNFARIITPIGREAIVPARCG